MATILTQPDALSLSANIKKFVVTSSADVTFKLYYGATLLIDELYSPGTTGRVEIDVKEIVKNELSFNLPSSNIFQQNDIAKPFIAYINSTPIIFKVLRAGVNSLSDTPVNFLSANFLTWQPQTKKTSYYQPEWLSYYSNSVGYVKVKFYLTNGTSHIHALATMQPGTCWTFNMQFAHIMSLRTEERYGYYDVWVEDATGSRTTYIQRYIYNESQAQDEFFLFENSLGGIDTAVMTGESTFAPEMTYASGIYNEENSQLDGSTTRLYSKNTGYKSETEAAWLWDFACSLHRYKIVNGALSKIVLTGSDIAQSSLEPMKTYTFTYRLSMDEGLLKISRTTDSLPANLQITTPEGLFFLAPRLVDFPNTTPDDTLLFPVQSPFSETWKTLSWGEIWNIVYNKVMASAVGLATHIHDNLTVLAKLTESNGQLFFNNVQVGGASSTSKRTYQLSDATTAEKTGAYIEIDKSGLQEARKVPLASLGVSLGETSTTAYPGDKGKIAFNHTKTAPTLSPNCLIGVMITTLIPSNVVADYINIEVKGFGKVDAGPFFWSGQTYITSETFADATIKSIGSGEMLDVRIFVQDSVVKVWLTGRTKAISNFYNIQAAIRYGNDQTNLIGQITDSEYPTAGVSSAKQFKNFSETFNRPITIADQTRLSAAISSTNGTPYKVWVGTTIELAGVTRDETTFYIVI